MGTAAWQLEPAVVEIGAGQDVITGGVASITVTVVPQVAWLPAPSATVIVIAVVPGPTGIPGAGLCVTVSAPGGVQLSVAETAPVTSGIAPWQLAPAAVLIGVGQDVITGGVVSTTVTLAEQVAWFPAASITVILTVVTPGPTSVPAAGD